MAEIDATIFIDANQYLDLYRVAKGKQLLDPLKEQKEYIFVTAQIRDEVQRNKLSVAAEFLTKQFEELKVGGLTYRIIFSTRVLTRQRSYAKNSATSEAKSIK